MARGRIAELLHVPFIQQLHHAKILAATLQDHLQQRLQVEIHVRHRREQGFLDERADLLVGFAEPSGMVGVGGHALQAVEQHFLQRLHILVLAADAGTEHASAAVSRLFALITEHEFGSFPEVTESI